MNTNAPPVTKFDYNMFRASLAYYGKPDNYTHTFKLLHLTDRETKQPLYKDNGEPLTALVGCNPARESRNGNAVWVQVNESRPEVAFKTDEHGNSYSPPRPRRAHNEDIAKIANITLDAEYPPEPERALRIGIALAAYLVEQGLAEPGLPVENSGAGPHIGLPLPAIEITRETAKLWNEAVRAVVKQYILPEFSRLCEHEQVKMDLSGFDISRVLSLPGTWRPTNPNKADCEALKQGHLRCWLAPYTNGNYPVRKESARLAELIKEEYARLENTALAPQPLPYDNPSDALQWLYNYAAKHPDNDRSAHFQRLVDATYLKYGADMVETLKDDINELSGEKYNGRLDDEIKRSLDNAKKKLPRTKDLCSFSADDAGNGDALFALFGQDFLYCSTRGWFTYTGTHWQLDADGATVKRRAVETLRTRRIAAVKADKELIVKCTKADESRVSGCVSRFKTLVSVSIDEFDTHPDKLNCKNGVVDMRTGEIEKHAREQRFTYCLPVEYDQADYFEWIDYLNGVIGGGQEVIDYLQMALGYSFTGHTQEEILFYLFGPTRSGKGTFAETIMALLPTPISKMVDFNSFTAKREGDVSNFDLAPLKPSRIIFASESNKSQSLNPAKIKL